MSINLPPELLASLTSAAERAGITVEEFVVIAVQDKIRHVPEGDGKPLPANGGPTLYDRLSKYIGTFEGPAESYSDDKLADMIVEDIERERRK